MGLFRELFRTRSIESLQEDAHRGSLKRTLNGYDLALIGIGEIIGAGVFSLTGTAANREAGPGLILSFIISGTACALAGLCYSELAALVPTSGSAYTYIYCTCGELLAWIIGWDLMLEYLIGAATVAVSWSQYLMNFITLITGFNFSPTFLKPPIAYKNGLFLTGELCGSDCGIFNLPAVIIVALCTFILCVGIKESANVNHILVFIKIAIVLLFICATFDLIRPENWSPFIPERTPDGRYGFSGVLRGATQVFFAYIGFDAVSTCAGETKNPARDVPIGVLGSLSICTILYILVSMNITGIEKYTNIPTEAPLASVVRQLGRNWLSTAISLGAIVGLTSVILVSLLGQPRVWYSMAYDGLFPASFAKVHAKYRTPYIPTIISGIICALASAFLPLDVLGDITSAGTLFAFALVSAATGILRYKRPDLERPFRVPLVYLVSLLGFTVCIALIILTGWETILRVIIWMAIGLIIYASYGYRHSRLRTGAPPPDDSSFSRLQDIELSEEELKS